MNRTIYVSLATLLAVSCGLKAQSAQIAEVRADYQSARDNILKAAEKMPDADYGFKPTPGRKS